MVPLQLRSQVAVGSEDRGARAEPVVREVLCLRDQPYGADHLCPKAHRNQIHSAGAAFRQSAEAVLKNADVTGGVLPHERQCGASRDQDVVATRVNIEQASIERAEQAPYVLRCEKAPMSGVRGRLHRVEYRSLAEK